MPSRPPLTLANAYTLIVESGNTTDPNVRWRNTWDIHASVEPAPSDPVITDIINFHLYNLRTDAGVFMLTLRNWSQGPQPFISRPFLWEYNVGGTAGLKTGTPPHGYNGEGAGNQSIPGSAVLFAKRQTLSGGKQTSLFLRGLLDDVDVVAETGGRYVYATGGHVNNASFGAIVTSVLTPYLGAGKDPGLIIVHVGNHYAGPAFSSPITGVVGIGPSQNKQTRKNKK